MIVAIIGRRHPSPAQIHEMKYYLRKFDADTIVTGCSNGVEAVALRYAKEKGLKTIGCVPWTTFKMRIQCYCDEIQDLSKIDDVLKEKAFESVSKYHPEMSESSEGFLLQARIYLIVYQAHKVIAFTSSEDYGGTVQGIRLAKALGIPFTVIRENGTEIADLKEFRQ